MYSPVNTTTNKDILTRRLRNDKEPGAHLNSTPPVLSQKIEQDKDSQSRYDISSILSFIDETQQKGHSDTGYNPHSLLQYADQHNLEQEKTEPFSEPPRTNAQTIFHLHVTDLNEILTIETFQGREAIHETFHFTVLVSSPNNKLNLDDLAYKTTTITLQDNAGEQRHINGLITEIEKVETTNTATRFQLIIEPTITQLKHKKGRRVFQNQSVPTIVQQIFKEAGIAPDAYEFRLNKTYEPREYCIQYDEDELTFTRRILAEEGIHFHFTHDNGAHLLILADSQDSFSKGRNTALPYSKDDVSALPYSTITELSRSAQISTGNVKITGRDFTKPQISLSYSESPLSHKVPGDLSLSDRYFIEEKTEEEGKKTALNILEEHQIKTKVTQGKSSIINLSSGHYYEVEGHSNQDWNNFLLNVETNHQGVPPQHATGRLSDKLQYQNEFRATPHGKNWRPQRIQKPKIDGIQIATVVGLDGDDIHTDQYGRIKIRFIWDREGKSDCWVRVAQIWSGNGYGSSFIPRVGMEVFINFVNGDPDKPLATSSGFNSQNMPPNELPDNKDQLTLKTLSSPGGKGYNQLQFNNKAGEEQALLHAQKDVKLTAEQHYRETVKNNKHSVVGGNQYLSTEQDSHQTTQGNQIQSIAKDLSFSIGGSTQHRSLMSLLIKALKGIHLESGVKVVFRASAEITISLGNSFIKLDPTGVTLSGPIIKLNPPNAVYDFDKAAPKAPESLTLDPPVAFTYTEEPHPDVVRSGRDILVAAALHDRSGSTICQKKANNLCSLQENCACNEQPEEQELRPIDRPKNQDIHPETKEAVSAQLNSAARHDTPGVAQCHRQEDGTCSLENCCLKQKQQTSDSDEQKPEETKATPKEFNPKDQTAPKKNS